MKQRLFISYTTKNQWVIPGLTNLIKAVLSDPDIFCSATGSIDPGDNYRKVIFESLHEADVFIAIVSNDYWKSKYCIVELGAAYQRYCYDPDRHIDIQPLLLPPLEKSMAMANTPLTEIQVADMTNADELSAFLRRLAGPDHEAKVDAQQVAIAEYIGFLKATLLKTASLTDGAEVNAYYDEPAANPIPRDSVVRALRTDRDVFRFEFNLSKAAYSPSFASMALEYIEEINLQDYLKYDRSASFNFRLNNVGNMLDPDDAGVLESIDVEFKSGPVNAVFRRVTLKLEPGINQLSIPLAEMNYRPLSEVRQICFVIHPKEMKMPVGAIVIDQIYIAFEEKNILAE